MCFLAEMKVSHERVLREVDEQESREDEQGAALPIACDCLGNEIGERHAQHEPRRERDEQLEGARAPRAPRGDGGGTRDVRGCGDERVNEGVHERDRADERLEGAFTNSATIRRLQENVRLNVRLNVPMSVTAIKPA